MSTRRFMAMAFHSTSCRSEPCTNLPRMGSPRRRFLSRLMLCKKRESTSSSRIKSDTQSCLTRKQEVRAKHSVIETSLGASCTKRGLESHKCSRAHGTEALCKHSHRNFVICIQVIPPGGHFLSLPHHFKPVTADC